jgi:hypothetical protein
MSVYSLSVVYHNGKMENTNGRMSMTDNPRGDYPQTDFSGYSRHEHTEKLLKFFTSNEGSQSVVLHVSDSITCRETLVHNIQYIQDDIRTAISNTVFGTGFFVVGLDEMQSDELEKFLEFGRKYINNNVKIRMRFFAVGNFPYISIQLGSYNFQRNSYFLSAILWSIRIRAHWYVLAHPQEFRGGSMVEFCNDLSTAFLKHNGWGDEYNSNVNLSLFFYGWANGGTFPDQCDGPSTAGGFATFSTGLNWIKNIYIPTFPNKRGMSFGEDYASSSTLVIPLSEVINLYYQESNRKESKDGC